MQENNSLDHLKKVKKVEAPPFLFTRIEAKIEAQQSEQVPVRWVVSSAVVMAILLVFNVSLLRSDLRSEVSTFQGVETVAAGMDLNPSNQLYHE